ncbi:hypothetical protein N658DRAFT_500654 [Parathielavia hyrcaniae]|uniref:Zn(2)-C6 fungal-type domain-containing protein n=1 Tax=Parathielavia hyrcaniae TaxID=113614 RepID=A0AAN6PV87_9PEZI|nr:hypothetical protein N658DRAFT_500654 [Parathielavia hyrcaniae]
MSTPIQAKGVAASYGKACTNCARAKCRCTYRSVDDAVCERCNRLKRECTLQPSVRKWNGRQTSSARISHLEDKVEQLVGLLSNNAANKPFQLENQNPEPEGRRLATPLASTELGSHGADDPLPDDHEDCSDVSGHGPAIQVSLSSGSRLSSSTPRLPGMARELAASAKKITPQEAEDNLAQFRAHNAYSCPFLCLPPGMTSDQLSRERPFLWLNIMAATTRSLPQQRLMNQAITQHLALEMVVGDQRSMDLLWGLLVFMSWSHYHQKMKPHFTVMGCLAHSLIYDLVLNKPQLEPSSMALVTNHASCKALEAQQGHGEAQRALLGCFLVTSMVAIGQKRLEPLKWTSYCEESLDKLSKQPEWLGDTVLVAAVRYQLVVNQLTQTPRQSHDGGLPSFYIDALRSQIQTIRRDLPSELASNEILTTYHLHTNLLVSEASLKSLDTAPSSLSSTSADLDRHTSLSAQLDTVRCFLDLLLFIPPLQYLSLPFGFWDEAAHFLATLFRLATRADVVWDGPVAVRAVVDVPAVCEQLASRFLQAGALLKRDGELGEEEEDEADIFTRSHRWVKGLGERCVAETRTAPGNYPVNDSHSNGAGPQDIGMGRAGGDGACVDGTSLLAGVGFVYGAGFGSLPTLPMLQSGDGWFTDIFQMSWD